MGLSACLHLYVHFLLTVFIYSCQNLVGDHKRHLEESACDFTWKARTSTFHQRNLVCQLNNWSWDMNFQPPHWIQTNPRIAVKLETWNYVVLVGCCREEWEDTYWSVASALQAPPKPAGVLSESVCRRLHSTHTAIRGRRCCSEFLWSNRQSSWRTLHRKFRRRFRSTAMPISGVASKSCS